MKTRLKDVLNKISWLFIPYLVILCGCLIIKLYYDRETIYFAVNAIHNSGADYLAPYITDIGEGVTVLIIAALLSFYSYRQAFLLATGFLITGIVAQALKHIVKMPRPLRYFEHQLPEIYFVKGVHIVGGMRSFPSGHTVTAFSAAVVITYLVKNKMWGVVCLLVALLVGYSRMYLSQHFFEDVTVGSAIGTFITVFWLSYIDNKEFIRSPQWNRGIIKR